MCAQHCSQFYFSNAGFKLTLKSPGCRWGWISLLCFLLEDKEDNRWPPFSLLEGVKSSLENLCFDASERGETGD